MYLGTAIHKVKHFPLKHEEVPSTVYRDLLTNSVNSL